MTHPDIKKMERDGFIIESKVTVIGNCVNCNTVITDEYEFFSGKDGLFCTEECFKEHYEFSAVN